MHYINLGFTTLSKKIQDYIKITRKSSLMDNSETQAVLGTIQLLSCIDY
jgi:hypothetical protein